MSGREDKGIHELQSYRRSQSQCGPSAWRRRHRRRFPSTRGRELTAELAALERGCTNWKFNIRECKPVRALLPAGEHIPSGVRILTDLHADDDNDDRRIHTLQMNKIRSPLYTNSSVCANTRYAPRVKACLC